VVATVRRTVFTDLGPEAEAFAARLARVAYEVALRHGITGPFTDLELALWREVREVVRGRDVEMCCVAGGAA
jgi:hypothetical protein